MHLLKLMRQSTRPATKFNVEDVRKNRQNIRMLFLLLLFLYITYRFVSMVISSFHLNTLSQSAFLCKWYEQAGNESSYNISSALIFDGLSFIESPLQHESFLNSSRLSRIVFFKAHRFDITLISQMSFNRMYLLVTIAQRWTGPIVYVIFLRHKSQVDQLTALIMKHTALAARRNIVYRIVFDKLHKEAVRGLYPTNMMRNIALRTVRTPFTLHLDADFTPNINIYDRLQHQLRSLARYNIEKKTAYVIPAFEFPFKRDHTTKQYTESVPENKTDLLNAWLVRRKVQIFNKSGFPYGHALTNYTRWINATAPYAIEWTPSCYEPYLLIKTQHFPIFDPRFVGYDFNKIQHTFQLIAQGFRFVVLPNSFVVHLPHKRGGRYSQKSRRQPCLRRAMADFFAELDSKHSSHTKLFAFSISELIRERAAQNNFTELFCSSLSNFS